MLEVGYVTDETSGIVGIEKVIRFSTQEAVSRFAANDMRQKFFLFVIEVRKLCFHYIPIPSLLCREGQNESSKILRKLAGWVEVKYITSSRNSSTLITLACH